MLTRQMLSWLAALSTGLTVSMPANAATYSALQLSAYPEPGTNSNLYLYDVNASGQVVGSNGTGTHPFITGANGLGVTYLGFTGDYAFPYAINASGQVAGESGSMFAFEAFSTAANGAGMAGLGHLGGGMSGANGINTAGQVVGWSYNGNYAQHAFISDAGVMRDLGTLGGGNSSANGINTSGQVVGWSYLADFSTVHAFITAANGGAMSDLGTTGAWSSSNAYAVNDAGQAVGSLYNSSEANGHAFLTGANGTAMFDMGTLGGRYSGAYDINAAGQVVGWSYLADYSTVHAFVTDANGHMVDLNSLVGGLAPGEFLVSATGINDRGQIIAASSFTGHAYLLTPAVPEPETYALLLLGVSMVGWFARRRGVSR